MYITTDIMDHSPIIISQLHAQETTNRERGELMAKGDSLGCDVGAISGK